MTGYEVASCDVGHQGAVRTVKVIRDAQTLEPYFPASVWLVNEYHRAPNSYHQLARHIANFLTFARNHGVSPLDVDRYFLEAYCDKHLFREKSLEVTTILTYYSSIVQFYRGMEKLGYIEKAIEIKEYLNSELQESIDLAEGVRDSLDPFNLYTKYLQRDDFETLAGSVPRKQARLRRRDELILRTGYETGCRAAEVVDPNNFSISRIRAGVRRAEEQSKSEFLYAIIGKGRGAGKPRNIAIPTGLAKDILRYVDTYKIPGDIAFGSQSHGVLHRTHPTKLFKECVDAIILNGDANTPNLDLWVKHRKTRTFHALRHTYATNLANLLRAFGENYEHIRERMGHARFSTTMVYINFETLLFGTQEEQNAQRAEQARTADQHVSAQVMEDELD